LKFTKIGIDIHRLANNPLEWIEPEKFIPERFDPKSPFFLTPAGKARNPYSFSPFLGGHRICIGKTFVENVSKLVVPSLLYHFDFDLLDGVDKESFEMPNNHMANLKQEKIDLLLTAKKLH
jgi:cytochrome P450